MRMSEWRAEMDAKVGPPRVWRGKRSSLRAYSRRIARQERKQQRAAEVAARHNKKD